MRLLSARILIPAAIVVMAWGGAHLLAQPHSAAVEPAAWPGAALTPSAAPQPTISTAPLAASAPALAAPRSGGIPILPGALQQLNGDTRDTAIGLYALIQQLEAALRGHLSDLVRQLEPGH